MLRRRALHLIPKSRVAGISDVIRGSTRLALVFTLACLAHAAQAADISVVGLFPGKAVLVVDGATPRTFSVGATVAPAVRLIAANDSGATLSVDGTQETLAIGQHSGGGPSSSGNGRAVLHADGRGHFFTTGQINGMTVRMMVDTGASVVSLPAHDASRLGIDYRQGTPGHVNTANGVAPAWRVKLDTVKVGEIELHQVDGLVMERGLQMTLLGMSFLNRTEMRRNGETMTLTKRY